MSLGHPSKFQQVLNLGFVTARTSLNEGQLNFPRCLAISCTGTQYIHFWVLLPLTEFRQVQNSLCAHVLRSPILSVLMHGTLATGISQTLRHSAEGATYIRRETITFSAHILIFTVRRSYTSAVLGVIILSVCCACFVTNPKNLPAIF